MKRFFPIVAALIFAPTVEAAIVTDHFQSDLHAVVTLLPAWTGLPGPVDVDLWTWGPTWVNRNTVGTGNPDTFDTEIVSIDLSGNAAGFKVRIRAGQNNGFFPSLPASPGMIQENVGPPNGVLDQFPAYSEFDVFHDFWVDLNANNIAEVGEVLRNMAPTVMVQAALGGPDPTTGQFPPPFTVYQNQNPVQLYVVNPDGTLNFSAPHAIIADVIHEVKPVPEPTTFAVWSLLGLTVVGAGWWRRRQTVA